jgi:NADH-quinone oxidoreductase subunit M
MLGLFALNPLGVQGSVLQMVNHGLSTGALFALVGMLYERYHTRQIADLGDWPARMPVAGVFHGAVHVLQHRRAGPERLCGRVS